MYAGLGGVLARAGLRAHRARDLRLPALDRLPGDDRHRRARLDRRRDRRRGARHRAAAGPRPLQRLAAVRRRAGQRRPAGRRRPRASSTAPRSSPSSSSRPTGWPASARRFAAPARRQPPAPFNRRRAPHERPTQVPRQLARRRRCCWPAPSAAAAARARSRRIVGRRRVRVDQDRPRRHRQARSRLGLLTDLSRRLRAARQADRPGAPSCTGRSRTPAGGVCDRTVKLVVKDHGYDPQKAVVQYRDARPTSPALQQLLGSPITAALLPTLKKDSMLSLLAAWPSSLLSNDVHHRDRRDLRHRDDQRPRLPHGARASSRRATRSATSTSRATTARTA